MDNDLRAIILKLETRLGYDDRVRLHFFVGNHVPRSIREDVSLAGTLRLMESLIDQDKISEEDFTFLTNAFDKIQCTDAAKLLREQQRRIESSELSQSIPSLASILPSMINDLLKDQEEDKYATKPFLDTNNVTGNNGDINIVSAPVFVSDLNTLPKLSKDKHMLSWPSVFWTCPLLFILLLITVVGIRIYINKNNTIETSQLEIKNNRSDKINQQLSDRNNQFHKNETILMATVYPRLACSVNSFVKYSSMNYQVQHLNFSCSQSLSNLTITHVVQRTYNEIHAEQYQTLWKDTTNMTYTQNSTQIIYTWYSLPGRHISKEYFPYFVEVQFYYTSGSTRITRNDTWEVFFQSIYGDSYHRSGTF